MGALHSAPIRHTNKVRLPLSLPRSRLVIGSAPALALAPRLNLQTLTGPGSICIL